ncbi:hypothetical protein LTR78_002094 [Recurvomyces mirabilis]|uniref:Uncharacterized protein n=1 Tax=Recurvomyces mirabilis TaxID=574656 RepID=A0AAE0WTP9_9PEZI|nr:hypothetical protein LTR78_002094 [Recurvomyces mirabilis]KAK5160552.1 hypothetical protein LTS14_001564 [Recurvomyces mirabilis]
MYALTPFLFAALAMSAALPQPAAVEVQARHNPQYVVKFCSGNNCSSTKAGNAGGCHKLPKAYTSITFDSHLSRCIAFQTGNCAPSDSNDANSENVGELKNSFDVTTSAAAKASKMTSIGSFYCEGFWH